MIVDDYPDKPKESKPEEWSELAYLLSDFASSQYLKSIERNIIFFVIYQNRIGGR